MICLNDLWYIEFSLKIKKNRPKENDLIIYHFIVTILIYILKSQNSF